jgi:hypothetical protein
MKQITRGGAGGMLGDVKEKHNFDLEVEYVHTYKHILTHKAYTPVIMD